MIFAWGGCKSNDRFTWIINFQNKTKLKHIDCFSFIYLYLFNINVFDYVYEMNHSSFTNRFLFCLWCLFWVWIRIACIRGDIYSFEGASLTFGVVISLIVVNRIFYNAVKSSSFSKPVTRYTAYRMDWVKTKCLFLNTCHEWQFRLLLYIIWLYNSWPFILMFRHNDDFHNAHLNNFFINVFGTCYLFPQSSETHIRVYWYMEYWFEQTLKVIK